MKFFYYIFIITVVVLIGRFWFLKNYFPVKNSVVVEKIDDNLPETISELPETPSPEKMFVAPSPIIVSPVSFVNLGVPFTSQAPYGVWDALHEEACEEASIIMANAWAKNISSLSRESAESEIQKLVKWQNDNLGYFESTTAKQTAEMAKKFYGLNYKLIENPSVEDLKNELKEGNVIVMGMGGRILNNPHFTSLGPIYHMLLIKGFDETGFITNDPGTKYGKNYHYLFSTLMSAGRDWSGGRTSTITKPPVAIIFSK
jgi:hypothetical protein